MEKKEKKFLNVSDNFLESEANHSNEVSYESKTTFIEEQTTYSMYRRHMVPITFADVVVYLSYAFATALDKF